MQLDDGRTVGLQQITIFSQLVKFVFRHEHRAEAAYPYV